MLSQLPKWRPTQSYTNRAGAHSPPDAPPHRQLHCIRNIEPNHQTETIKSNGYEIPLADRQSPPKTI
jgi:hypothetical protein